VACLAARRSGQNNLQVAAIRAASQRLELAITKAEDLLFRDAREAQGEPGSFSLVRDPASRLLVTAEPLAYMLYADRAWRRRRCWCLGRRWPGAGRVRRG